MRRIIEISLTSVMSLALVAGCADREVARVDPAQNKEQFKDIPVQINRNIDILFMVDNSGSMAEEQENLIANFPLFMERLEGIEGGLPNVHIGVVSSDLGAGPFNIRGCTGNGHNGRLLKGEFDDCPGIDGRFLIDIEDGDGGRHRNYEGELAERFTCMARLGDQGCGFEQQFESVYRALDGSNADNDGFLRKDAFLAVIFLTDEDDCSTRDSNMFDTSQMTIDSKLGPLSSYRCFEFGVVCDDDQNIRSPGQRQSCRSREDSEYMYPVSRYVNFLKSLKDDPTDIIVAGIIGDANPVAVHTNNDGNPELTPSCSAAGGTADPAVRVKQFLEYFPLRNNVTSICQDNLAGSLLLIADLLAKVIGNPCIEGALKDFDPNTPGIQPECQVSDVRFPNSPLREETPMPHCDAAGGAKPCWRLEENQEACYAYETKLELIIERADDNVPTGTHVQARCVVE